MNNKLLTPTAKRQPYLKNNIIDDHGEVIMAEV